MTFRGPTPADIRRLMRDGQEAFQRGLAAKSLDAARRLQRAYGRVRDALDRDVRVAAAMGFDDQALRRLRGRVADGLDGLTTAIREQASAMQQVGAGAGVAAAGGKLGVRWNQPLPEQIEALMGYVDSPAFREVLDGYGAYHAEGVIDRILTQVSQGRDPEAVVRSARAYLKQMPFFDAVRLVRTTQLWSARRGMQAVFQANRDQVRGWAWSSALDVRTCPSCWVMHGTVHGVDELLNDHHLGRCAMAPLTQTWEALGFAGGSDMEIERGEDVFGRLPAREQQQVLGMARWRAWQDRLFDFSQLSATYQNPLFGEMRREASLSELIGEQAAQAYMRAGSTDGPDSSAN